MGKKKKLMRITALFFAFIFSFTVLSRASWQYGTAVVNVSRPENRMISHRVVSTGKVVQNQELAVVTEPDQRVTAICVKEGQQVKKGDLLFEIEMKLLDEKILNQQQEMEKQKLQVQDARSQKEVSAMQKADQQAQAAENYALNTESASVRLARARRQLSEARKKLKDFRKSSGTKPQDSGVEEALENAFQEKQEAYLQAARELAQLQWQIEKAVDDAKTQAQNGSARAGLELNDTVHTGMREGSADGLLEDMTPEVSAGSGQNGRAGELLPSAGQKAGEVSSIGAGWEESRDQLPEGSVSALAAAPEDALLEDTTPELSGESGWQDTEGQTQGNMQADISGIGSAQTDIPGTDSIQMGNPASDNVQPGEGSWDDDVLLEDDSSEGDGQLGGTGQTDGSQGGGGGTEAPSENQNGSTNSLTQAQLEAVEKEVRADWQSRLDAAQSRVDQALQEKEAAQAALASYQQERLAAADSQEAQTEQQLVEAVQTANDAYVDASLAANEVSVTSGRAVASSGIPDASNSSDRMNEITYEQMELELGKLEELKASRGKVYAPVDGMITKINITTGEKTSDTTAILMADLEKGFRFVAEITREQEKYIGTGDLVTLTSGNKKMTLEEQEVTAVRASEEQEDIYEVTVELPADSFDIGTAVTMEFEKKSSAYPCCIPLSALHLDEKNQTYVLVTDEYQSVMGTELRARKVSVKVLEQNESYAALEEGSLTSQQQVITRSDRTVEEQSRVRIQK